MDDELVLALSAYGDYLKKNGIVTNLRLVADVNIPLSNNGVGIWVIEADSAISSSLDLQHFARRGDWFQFEGLEAVPHLSEEMLCRFYLVKNGKRTEEFWIADLYKAVKYIPDFKKYIDAAKAHLEQRVRDRFKKNMEKKQNENAKLQKLDPLFGSW